MGINVVAEKRTRKPEVVQFFVLHAPNQVETFLPIGRTLQRTEGTIYLLPAVLSFINIDIDGYMHCSSVLMRISALSDSTCQSKPTIPI